LTIVLYEANDSLECFKNFVVLYLDYKILDYLCAKVFLLTEIIGRLFLQKRSL
jgi:hypothetical protein